MDRITLSNGITIESSKFPITEVEKLQKRKRMYANAKSDYNVKDLKKTVLIGLGTAAALTAGTYAYNKYKNRKTAMESIIEITNI